MSNIEKIINFLISFIITSTFVISLFVLIYVELYARDDIAAIDAEFKEFCLGLTQPPGGIGFYMFIYDKLFPFGFLMILISAIIILTLYFFIFLKIFACDKKMFFKFAISAILIFFLIPLSFFFTSIFISSSLFFISIAVAITTIILTIIIFAKLKIPFYNKYKLIVLTWFVFLSYFLLFGAWIDTKHSIYYDCVRYIN